MPLYNVMERGMRLPKIGTIRKGFQTPVIDKESGKPKKRNGEIVTRPVEAPHFVFHIDAAQEAEVMGVLLNAYGTMEIRQLNVFLAYPDPYQAWTCWMEAYNFNQLIARSDERTVTYLFDTESNETLIRDGIVTNHSSAKNSVAGNLVKDIAIGGSLPYDPEMIVGQSKSSERAITFKAVGRLTVVIPELQRLATFTLLTGGYWFDIPQISSTIQIIDQVVKSTGRGANTLPLVLRRVEREGTYTADDGSKKKKIRNDVELEIRGDIIAGLLSTYNDSPFALALKQQPTLPILPVGATSGEPEEDFDSHIDEPIEAQPLFMTSEQAKQVIVHVRGKEKFMGELTPEQLLYASQNGNGKMTQEQIDAATILLDELQGGL